MALADYQPNQYFVSEQVAAKKRKCGSSNYKLGICLRYIGCDKDEHSNNNNEKAFFRYITFSGDKGIHFKMCN